MVQVLQAKEVTLRDLINRFELQFVEDEQFFGEWQENLGTISNQEKELLDKFTPYRIVQNQINIIEKTRLKTAKISENDDDYEDNE